MESSSPKTCTAVCLLAVDRPRLFRRVIHQISSPSKLSATYLPRGGLRVMGAVSQEATASSLQCREARA
jgi:hypothetical protein